MTSSFSLPMPKKKHTARARGSIVPRGDRRYLVRVFLGRDDSGKRNYLAKTVEGTRTDAEKALERLLVGVEEQTVVPNTKQTVGDYLNQWLKNREGIEPKTRRDYEDRIRLDLIPNLGEVQLTSLTRERCQKLVKTLQTERKLSRRTIEYDFMVLKQALTDAVRDGRLARSPAQYVELPKRDHVEMRVLSPEQVSALLEYTAGSDLQRHALWTLLLTTGLRPQEALALKWNDLTTVTRDDGTEAAGITIVRALKRVGSSQWEVGAVKTRKGQRSVPLPQDTYAALKAHRARQRADILRHGAKYRRDEFIFACRHRSLGKHLDVPSVRRWWKAALRGANLPQVRLYDARHTHATLLLRAGVHAKVAQARLGHSTFRLTMDTYSHVVDEMQQEATDVMDKLLTTAASRRAASQAV